MPFPRSRLDVYWVFSEVENTLGLLEAQLADWIEDDVLLTDGSPGMQHAKLGCGSFTSVQIVSSTKHMLFANHQGGYRVFCPNNDKIATLEFLHGVSKWRHSELDPSAVQVSCQTCGGIHTLTEFVGRPTFAFGRIALHFNSVSSASFSSVTLDTVRKTIGPFTPVLKRVG